jgi:hypothetical protein
MVPSAAPPERVAVTVVVSANFKVLTAGVSEKVRDALLIVTAAVAVSASKFAVSATAIWAEHDPACKTVIVAVSLIEQVSGVEVEYVRVPVPRRVVAVEARVAVGEYVTVFESAKVNDITCGARLTVNVPATTVTLS